MRPLALDVAEALAALDVARTDRLAVAVSGGRDSMVLLYLLAELEWPLVAVHVDHQLREGAADDAVFVAEQAAALGVAFEQRVVDVGTGNVQAEARRARYAALAEVARQSGGRWVVTAHTATDQAETVLMALARGAGLRGLGGMPPRRRLAKGVDLIRPLLQTSREEVARCADDAGWPWREDPTNATRAFRRNRVRQDVLPALRAEGGAAVDRRIASAAADARASLALVSDRLAVVLDGDRLDLTELGRQPALRTLLIAEALAHLAPEATRSRALVERIERLVAATVGASVESGGVRVWRETDALRIDVGTHAPTLSGRLVIEPLDHVPLTLTGEPMAVVVDRDRATSPVTRLWSDGDRMRPLGMDGSKKVSDLLRERGVPRADRAGVPVVVVGGSVVWVVGHRLAADVAVTDATRHADRWTWREDPG